MSCLFLAEKPFGCSASTLLPFILNYALGTKGSLKKKEGINVAIRMKSIGKENEAALMHCT